MADTYTVIAQRWRSRTPGRGYEPDGYSLHKSVNDLREFTRREALKRHAPSGDDFSEPDGDPFELNVPWTTYNLVQTNTPGIRCEGDPAIVFQRGECARQ